MKKQKIKAWIQLFKDIDGVPSMMWWKEPTKKEIAIARSYDFDIVPCELTYKIK